MTTARTSNWAAWAAPLLASAAVVGGVALWRARQRSQRRLDGVTCVITGASSGLGRGVALRLGAMGANVVVAARRTPLLEQLVDEIHACGGIALAVTTDVSRADDVQRLRDATVERFGRIDIWVNNAGLGAIGPFWDIPLEDHARLVDINLGGVIHGSHIALHQFRAQGRGTLVNVGSIESEVPLAYHASYAATKAAVLSLGRSLVQELRLAQLRDVHVATVMPWATDTPFDRHAANHSGHSVQLPLPDGAAKAVDRIVHACLHPQRRHLVGWKAKAAYAGHRLLPGLGDRTAARIEHALQIERAPAAAPTSGALHAPVVDGRAVEGHVRERMRLEANARDHDRAWDDAGAWGV
ncbi:SDR family NAD(P)-dependent oxidoreductase [Cognatilysobacter bugurensis]|uniref:Oxidoreductase n=1 Tax=Cognatilysobacter bugurensis TaxID=543356 RepID=A0A918SYZ6_9GAMM|nr:SDR family NAD(P)-dependent oxidoreductase [Lysobacter bugurensis]GHA79569.1 oxidoreductase [Lysobacter bugurensis]